jgi:NAD(P)-dependent dehydrogenase (short-subunit alcohol dehydrogenase family)
LAAEYGGRGIRTLTVSPGFMDTPLTASWHPSLRETIVGQSAASNPDDVARRIVGLVEDRDLPGMGEDYRV